MDLPDYEELSGVYLCSPEKAWDLLAASRWQAGCATRCPGTWVGSRNGMLWD